MRGIASQNFDEHTKQSSLLAILCLGKQHIHSFISKGIMKSCGGFLQFAQVQGVLSLKSMILSAKPNVPTIVCQ